MHRLNVDGAIPAVAPEHPIHRGLEMEGAGRRDEQRALVDCVLLRQDA